MQDPIQPDPRITIPPPEPKSSLKAPGVLIAVSVTLILLGFGLCAVGGAPLGDSHPVVVGMGAIAFWGGIVGLIIGFFWWVFALVDEHK